MTVAGSQVVRFEGWLVLFVVVRSFVRSFVSSFSVPSFLIECSFVRSHSFVRVRSFVPTFLPFGGLVRRFFARFEGDKPPCCTLLRASSQTIDLCCRE